MSRWMLALLLPFIISCFWVSDVLHAATSAVSIIEQQRDTFSRALVHLEDGDRPRFTSLAQSLKHYPLYPYLVYEGLQQDLSTISATTMHQFISIFSDSPIAGQFQKKWLHYQVGKKNWPNFLAGYTDEGDTGLACYALWARYQQEEAILSLHEEILPLWQVGYSQDKSCDLIFKAWANEGTITPEIAWGRIIKTIDQNDYSLTRYLYRFLPEEDQEAIEQWIALKHEPLMIEEENSLSRSTAPYQSLIAADIMKQLANDNPLIAADLWPLLSARYTFSERQRGEILHDIGLHLALSGANQAEAWIERVPATAQSKSIQEWRIRGALKKSDWFGTLRGISALSPELEASDRWQYWRARALDAQGLPDEAKRLYHEVSKVRSYYGFLANEKLSVPYKIPNERLSLDPQLIVAISNLPGIRRARELMLLDRELDARREWYSAIEQLSDVERLAAARLAQRMAWHSLALYTLSSTEQKNDLPLHFPLAHYHNISTQAKRQNIDPAWVFSIARQESHFRPDAKSSVGALGVMQLMPSTAKEVAKKTGLPSPSTWDLIQVDTNLQIAVLHLKDLLEEVQGNTILATAAYNAGVNRIKEWLPEEALDADQWIETVPYLETRHYLQNILQNYAIYRQLLGEPANLAGILNPIQEETISIPDSGSSI